MSRSVKPGLGNERGTPAVAPPTSLPVSSKMQAFVSVPPLSTPMK